jgi:hypothetical protein
MMNREKRANFRRILFKMDFRPTKDQVKDLLDTCDELDRELVHTRGKFSEQAIRAAHLQRTLNQIPASREP